MGASEAVGNACITYQTSNCVLVSTGDFQEVCSSPREILNVKNGSVEVWGIFALIES